MVLLLTTSVMDAWHEFTNLAPKLPFNSYTPELRIEEMFRLLHYGNHGLNGMVWTKNHFRLDWILADLVWWFILLPVWFVLKPYHVPRL